MTSPESCGTRNATSYTTPLRMTIHNAGLLRAMGCVLDAVLHGSSLRTVSCGNCVSAWLVLCLPGCCRSQVGFIFPRRCCPRNACMHSHVCPWVAGSILSAHAHCKKKCPMYMGNRVLWTQCAVCNFLENVPCRPQNWCLCAKTIFVH